MNNLSSAKEALNKGKPFIHTFRVENRITYLGGTLEDYGINKGDKGTITEIEETTTKYLDELFLVKWETSTKTLYPKNNEIELEKFEVGDKVRYLGGTLETSGINRGDEGIIIEIDTSLPKLNETYKIEWNNGEDWFALDNDITLVAKKGSIKPPVAKGLAGAINALGSLNNPQQAQTTTPPTPTPPTPTPVPNYFKPQLNIEKIGKAIRQERNNQGLTQRDLAKKSGFSQGTITRLETKGWTSLSCLFSVVAALGKELIIN